MKIKLHHLSLSLLEAVGYKVNRLVGGDWILLEAGLFGFEWPELGLSFKAVLQLSKAGQEASTKCLQLTFLVAHAVLNGKPEKLKIQQHFMIIKID